MKLLLDTHVLIWAAGLPERLCMEACALFDDEQNELLFSAASLWEVALKSSMVRTDLQVDARLLRQKPF